MIQRGADKLNQTLQNEREGDDYDVKLWLELTSTLELVTDSWKVARQQPQQQVKFIYLSLHEVVTRRLHRTALSWWDDISDLPVTAVSKKTTEMGGEIDN